MSDRQDKPRLIYIINSFDRGGAELGLVSLAENGLFDGFDVKIISIVRGSGGVEERLEQLGFPYRVLVDRTKMRTVDLPLAFKKLRGCIKENDAPDMVIASLPQANLLARIALWRSEYPLLVSFEHNTHLSRKLYESLFRMTSRRVDWLFSDSDVTGRAALRSRYPVIPERKTVVPLLCLEEGLDVRSPKKNAQFHVVSAARFTATKNLESVVRALVILKQRGREVRCTFFGEGPRASEYLRIAKKGGISDRFDMPGFVKNWMDVPADAFALASQHEGLCIALIEAMNAGIPAVAPMVGGLRDYADENTMEVISSPTPEELADALSTVFDDPKRSERKARAAQARVSQLFGRNAVRARLRQINRHMHEAVKVKPKSQR